MTFITEIFSKVRANNEKKAAAETAAAKKAKREKEAEQKSFKKSHKFWSDALGGLLDEIE